MKQDSAPLLAWHYTLGSHLLRILENGHILPHDQPDTPRKNAPDPERDYPDVRESVPR